MHLHTHHLQLDVQSLTIASHVMSSTFRSHMQSIHTYLHSLYSLQTDGRVQRSETKSDQQRMTYHTLARATALASIGKAR